jgi:GT2 family glycosyltransferase
MLASQTFRDFELVTSTKGKIPEAWNDALSRARGDFIVFTESDAIPLDDNWLKELSMQARKDCVLKGLEINPTDLNLCNLVCDAAIFEKVKFDESFPIGEDTELFARLRKMGVRIERVNFFPVIHSSQQTWKKTLTRGLRQGMVFVKIIYMHGRENTEDINSRALNKTRISPISNRIRIITENLLVLLGLFVGAIRYSSIVVRQKLNPRNGKREKSA